MITALRTVVPGVGAERAGAAASQPRRRSRRSLATLLNELSAVPTEIDLVLDDYHLVDGPGHPGRHGVPAGAPARRSVHLVISTRADPALPLARLRARGELVEIRAADLRFTPDEVAAYLNDVDRPRT